MARKRKRNTRAKKKVGRQKTGTGPKRAESRHHSGMFIVAALFFSLVFIYPMYYLYKFINRPTIPTMAIQQGSIDEPLIIRGIIIRDEKVYQSPAAGALSYYIKDFDRVKKDVAVCVVRDEEALELLEKDAAQVDKSLMELQARRSDISAVQKEADKINTRIKDTVDRSIYHYTTLDMEKTYTIKADVERNVQIRNQILLSESNGSLKSYADERSQYQQEMNQHVTRIVAEEAGILSESVDGLETALSSETRESLTKEQTLMQAEIPVSKKVVEKGDSAFKIITSNEWCIAAYIPNDSILDYEEGDIRRIYVEQGDEYVPMDMQVSKLNRGENESYVLFISTRNMLEFANKRSIHIKTADSVQTGYKIPNTAIVDRTFLKVPTSYAEEDGEGRYVLKKTGDLIEKARIAIKDEDEEYVYILQDFSNIKIGDVLAMPGGGTETYQPSEIISIKGVYLVNSGIAEFRKIDMEGNISENSGYTILDPASNKNIRSFDQIVSEAKSIQDGQVIF